MRARAVQIGLLVAGAAAGAGCPADSFVPDAGEVQFRDDFDGDLETGWAFTGIDASRLDLQERPGFARLYPHPPETPADRASTLLREIEGDFVLTTRMRFQTTVDLQLAGLSVWDESGRSVAFGLLSATGALGTFRGAILRADRLTGTVRSTEPTSLEDVYLRLERNGDEFRAAFSGDGQTYTRLENAVFNQMAERVRVGIGVGTTDLCTRNCDQEIPADFEFFEITRQEDDPGPGPVGEPFRDEFLSPQVAAGWEFINENPATHSLIERPGYFRIWTERGAFSEGNQVRNLFVREITGDFILETLLLFDPQAAQQFAGLLVYQNDSNAAALGLTSVSGERGAFRGLVLISIAGLGGGDQPPVQRYDATNASNPNQVWLRLLRSGDQLVGGFSEDGLTFSDFGNITVVLPDTVFAGVGATNGDFAECGAICDAAIPADFDYFEFTPLGEGGNGGNGGNGPAVLESVEIQGPDSVAGGRQVVYALTAFFSDDTTQDLTNQAEWAVGPPEHASIQRGLLSTTPVTATTPVTVAAVYTLPGENGETVHTAAKVVRITAPGAGSMCGSGAALALLASALPLALARARRAVR